MERLWAPWRLEYITKSAPPTEGCFLCQAWQQSREDADHLVLGRGQRALVIMNRFPYNNGHLMIAPVRHVGEMQHVDQQEAAEIWSLTAVCKQILADALNAQGFNIGINQGACAGAGVLDHIHVHIVPRWAGDTNYMPVLADIKVMPEALSHCYDQLRPAFKAQGL